MIEALKEISVEREGTAAIVTMRRPERRNALSLAMMRELTGALEELGGPSSSPAKARRSPPGTICGSCAAATSPPTPRSSISAWSSWEPSRRLHNR
jgi:hypothetical protein